MFKLPILSPRFLRRMKFRVRGRVLVAYLRIEPLLGEWRARSPKIRRGQTKFITPIRRSVEGRRAICRRGR